jgi:hypothetical protein
MLPIVLCQSVSTAFAKTAEWLPTNDEIAFVEAHVRLPAGASPVAKYERYYTGTWVSGRRIVIAVFLRRGGSTGVHIRRSRDMPIGIQDGGCAEVTVYFDIGAKHQTGAYCNGVA